MPNFTDMLSKAKEMQEKMKEAQDAIKKIEVEGEAGGNLVKVILSGDSVSGDYSPESKIRLVIVHETDRQFGRRADFFSYHLSSMVDVETLVYTPTEFETLPDILPALHSACQEGRVIYDAGL